MSTHRKLRWIAGAAAVALSATSAPREAAATTNDGGPIPAVCQANSGLIDQKTIGELLQDPASHELLRRYFPDAADNPQLAKASELKLTDIQKYAPQVFTDAKMAAFDTALTAEANSEVVKAPVHQPSIDRKPIVAVTSHVGVFNGQNVHYQATVEEVFLNDRDGQPAASIHTIAYVRDDVAHAHARPVAFLFNGGPGASSSPLHMTALGPFIRTAGKAVFDATAWKPNPYSPLDVTDLVFIDPVGTGFSRAFPGTDAKPCYTTTGDAREVEWIIKDWLQKNHREASPRYLAGESYGTIRAATIARDTKNLPFDGVLLVALVGRTPGNEMPFVTSLPTMAASAWFHEKIDRRGRDVGDVFREAVLFARTEYVSALIQGASLPASEKHEVALKMSALIGLPADLIEKNDLRVSKNIFMFNLLKDKGLRTGLLDTRVTAPLEPGQVGDIDDPALGVAPPRTAAAGGLSQLITPDSIGPIKSPETAAYLTQALGYATTEPYYSVNFSVNAAWKYDAGDDVIGFLAKAMNDNPHLRLFWSAGYYDLTTPAYEARYALDQAGIPGDRLTAVYFAGPHGVYSGEQNLQLFADAVRRFIEKRSP